MSVPGGPSAAEIIALVRSHLTINYVEVPVPTFLVYDYLITLDQEIKLFWKRSFTGASLLFLFVRYSTLICYAILGMVTFAPLSDTRYSPNSCALLTKAQAAFTMFQYIPWAAFSALRVLALSGMSWPLATVVFLLACAPAAANFTQYGFHLTGLNNSLIGCQGTIDATQEQVEILVIVARAGLILADFIGVVVTVVKTRKMARVPLSDSSRRSLGTVLLYDGVMYFAALLSFNIVDLALSVIAFVTPVTSGNYVTALTDPLTAVLVCRFLLDLQAANVSSMDAGSHGLHSSAIDVPADGAGSLVFARVMGSVGASLAPGQGADTDTLGGEWEDGDSEFEMSSSQLGNDLEKREGRAERGVEEGPEALLGDVQAPG